MNIKRKPASRYVQVEGLEGPVKELEVRIQYTGPGHPSKGLVLDRKIIPMMASAPALLDALRVLALTPPLHDYLTRHDPKALKQALSAIDAAEGVTDQYKFRINFGAGLPWHEVTGVSVTHYLLSKGFERFRMCPTGGWAERAGVTHKFELEIKDIP